MDILVGGKYMIKWAKAITIGIHTHTHTHTHTYHVFHFDNNNNIFLKFQHFQRHDHVDLK